MGPYLRLFYDLADTTKEREQLCRELMQGRVWDADISMVRATLDDIARLAARPDKVRDEYAQWLSAHLFQLDRKLKKARLSDTLLAQEVAAVLETVCESGNQYSNFTRGSRLPDWIGRALPVLHELWCEGSRYHGVYRDRNVPSPALRFMTDAINLFRPGTNVSSLDRLWSEMKRKHPKL